MGKKSEPMDVNYRGIPSGLGAGKIIKEAKGLDAAYDAGLERREKTVAIGNALAAAERRKAGIASTGFNRGLSDTGRNRVGK